jgi:serine/threonine-protein kinase GIN4
MERLLRRMVAPNADLRCTAKDAMMDDYWHQRPVINTHSESNIDTDVLSSK